MKNCKKVSRFLISLTLVLTLTACGNNSNTDSSAGNQQENENNGAENNSSDKETKQSSEKLGTFNQNASLDETVMFDENGVKITATGLNYTSYSAELEITIENNSGKDLSFISGSIGYSCNSINGYMVNEGYLNCDVMDGKKANDTISFSYNNLMLYGIDEIADMEIGFDIKDDDYNHTYSGPRQVKTSAFETHDYSQDCYQETIVSSEAMNTYSYNITYFSQDTLYDENGVKLLSSGVMINKDNETTLLLELENTTSDMVYMSPSDIAINGLRVNSSTWSSDAINPNKRCIVDVELSSVLDSEYWSVYGINDVGSVSLSLRQYNSDWNEIADEASLEVVVPGVKSEYDATGKEVYNKGGMRIIFKSVLEDTSTYSSDMYVLLIAENNSGKQLSIDDVYNSLSVNGFMTDYTFYSEEIANGECAALQIKLRESSLEKNSITSVSDISEIEIQFKITDEMYATDEATISIIP